MNIEALIPAIIAISSLMLFTFKTRWFSYLVICMSITFECIAENINFIALAACCACLIALLLAQALQSLYQQKHQILGS